MTYIEEARQIAAQCWCDDETKHIEMDAMLAEAVAIRIAVWMDSAAEFSRNQEFYHGIVTQIGEMFGDAAKTSDDGSVQEEVLALRVPELVEALISANALARPAAPQAQLPDQKEENRGSSGGAPCSAASVSCAYCQQPILPGQPTVSDEWGESGARMHIGCSAADQDGQDIDREKGDS